MKISPIEILDDGADVMVGLSPLCILGSKNAYARSCGIIVLYGLSASIHARCIALRAIAIAIA